MMKLRSTPLPILFLLFCLSVFPFSYASSQEWKEIHQFSPAQTLTRIKFLDAQTGFTAGSLYNGSKENIHITHDGGKSWTNANSGYTAMRFMDIFIEDHSTIFMSGNDGIVIRSIDSGATWQTMNTGTPEQLWGLHFLNTDLGFAVGSNGTIIRTRNGGTDWENVPSGISNLFYDVFFTNQGIGFASGSNVLYKTVDSGETWQPVLDFPFEAPADWIRSIKMVNELTGYACADIGRIYKTTDGGDQWVRLNSGSQEALFDIDFTDELNGKVCGFNGTILTTTDGGQNWKQLNSPLGKEHLYSIDMVSKDIGYIGTHMGHILKLDTKTGIVEVNYNEPIVYPNPCNNNVNVRTAITKKEVERIELCTLTGQCSEVDVTWKDDFNFNLDLSKGWNGLHFLRIAAQKKLIILPLIIQSN
jgi:photosystem II stability/assembly factor-like uncharacterized protein